MSLVWRKIQRSNKKAAKFRFHAIFQQLTIQLKQGAKWQPDNISIAWVHRRRRSVTKTYKWEPSITDPFKGIVLWPQGAESLEIVTTLYCDAEVGYEDKEWTFLVEASSRKGKVKAVAAVSLNLRLFINEETPTFTQTEVKLKLRPLNENVTSCAMNLMLSSALEKEGHANDLDMRSLASEISTAANHTSPFSSKDDDVANLASLEEAESKPGSEDFHEKVAQVASAMEDLLLTDSSKTQSAPERLPIAAALPTQVEKEEKKRPESRSSQEVGSTVISSNDSGIGPELKPSATASSSTTKTVIRTRMEKSSMTGTMTAGGLLDWCQEVTKGYRYVRIDNFSESFRNGLAFCAIVHHFHPDAFDFDSLSPSEIRRNCQTAFEAAEHFGVPRLLDPNDFVVMRIPDKIGVMSYVHSLRDSFTRGSRISSGNVMGTSSQLSSVSEALPTDANQSLYGLNDIDEQVFRAFDGFRKQRDEADAFHDNSTTILPLEKVSAVSRGGESIVTTTQRRKSQQESPTKPTTPLMTRKELMNPFDSDSDEEKKKSPVETSVPERKLSDNKTAEKERRRGSSESSGSLSLPNEPLKVQGEARDGELRKRAKELLAQYQADFEENGRESTPEEDDRKKRLREKAKLLIEDAKLQTGNGAAIPISRTLDELQSRPNTLPHPKPHSAPATRDVTPEQKKVSPRFEAYQFRNSFRGGAPPTKLSRLQEEDSVHNNNLVRPGVPALRRSSENLVSPEEKTEVVEVNVRGFPAPNDASETTFDRFKRFGSMRSQELADRVNILSKRVTTSIRSASVPKELGELTGGFIQRTATVQQSISVADYASQGEESNEVRAKITTDWEKDLQSKKKVAAEMEENARRLDDLNRRATEVEKHWRLVLSQEAGSEEEKSLMNEFISLLNERNVLVRREEHLGLIQKIQDHESRFQLVQEELGNLIKIEENEKTEEHKRKIDRLMEELMTIVNKRDELVTRLMQNEQGAEEDRSLQDALTGNPELINQDDKNCSIM